MAHLCRRIYLRTACYGRRSLQTTYNIYPHTKALEQEKQALYLTKTILKAGSPPTLNRHVHLQQEELEDTLNHMKDCIIQTNWFHLDDDGSFDKKYKRAVKDHIAEKVFLNMLRVIWSSKAAGDSSLLSTCMSYKPSVVAPWERLGKNIQVSGKHGHLVNGKTLLPLFASMEEVEATKNEEVQWDDVISPFFEFPEAQTHFQPNRGFHEAAPYPCPQTLFIINPTYYHAHINTGQGVFFSFAHALTYALSQGYQIGDDLREPIPIQCALFDGDSFYFLCYQLNTLNFSEDQTTVKNIAWIEPEHKLYERIVSTESESKDFMDLLGKRVFLEDYNRVPAELFIRYVLNPLNIEAAV